MRNVRIKLGSLLKFKVTHLVWCHHAFSQRNKATKRVVEVEVEGEEGWTKFEKGEGWGLAI